MIIDGRKIGPTEPPYIIAEISCNHNGVLGNALKLIQAAKDAGADAVKFQAYTADTITIDHISEEFMIQGGLWEGRNLHALYSKTQTPFEWFPALFNCARALSITPLASVFDKSSVDMLEKLHCPAYKIASMEITDHPLIKYAALTGKPLIISSGMASDQEIWDAMVYHHDAGPRAVLACVSGYPIKTNNGALYQIRRLQDYVYRVPYEKIGISDHTRGITIPIAATTMGACIIEKHLMLGDEQTEDYEFSLAPIQFGQMVREVKNVWHAMQQPSEDQEQPSRQLRRSLYIVQDVKAGEAFTEENVRSIRPAYGMEPGKLPWVLSRTAAVDLKRGTALKPEHIS